MYEQSVASTRFFCEHARRCRVNCHGRFRFTFGAVHCCVSSRIEYDLGRSAAHHRANLIRVGQINRIVVVADDFTGIGEAAL
jgi:hypothetical protein